MSGMAFGWARRARCTGGMPAKAVLLLMADYAGRDHDLYPSIATMAEELDASERTVQRAITTLIADGLIEREFRRTGTGKTTSSRYILAVEKKGHPDAAGVTERHPSGASDGQGRGDCLSPSPPSECHHHMNPLSDPECSDEHSSAGARAPSVDQIDEAWIALPEASRKGASSRRLFDAAWWSEVRNGGDPAAMVAACRAYAEDKLAWGASGRPVAAHRFIGEERWRAFAAAGPSGRAEGRSFAQSQRAGFAGPDALWAAVEAIRDEAFAVSWLSRAGWDEDSATLLATNEAGHRNLRLIWAEPAIAKLNITLRERTS